MKLAKTMHFVKYHALGNDYLVWDRGAMDLDRRRDAIPRICDRQRGIGADGILLPVPSSDASAPLVRIFNPDGSEAELSGNGIRIFARYLADRQQVLQGTFRVQTPFREVTCQVLPHDLVQADLGTASFQSQDIPCLGPPREVLEEWVQLGEQQVRVSAVNLGNPHCVLIRDHFQEAEWLCLGPLLESHVMFPQRTNVQFLTIVDRQRVRLRIWERGAGPTSASGTSSCAAVAVAQRLGLVASPVTVSTAGGEVQVTIDPDFRAFLLGPVTRIADFDLDQALLSLE